MDKVGINRTFWGVTVTAVSVFLYWYLYHKRKSKEENEKSKRKIEYFSQTQKTGLNITSNNKSVNVVEICNHGFLSLNEAIQYWERAKANIENEIFSSKRRPNSCSPSKCQNSEEHDVLELYQYLIYLLTTAKTARSNYESIFLSQDRNFIINDACTSRFDVEEALSYKTDAVLDDDEDSSSVESFMSAFDVEAFTPETFDVVDRYEFYKIAMTHVKTDDVPCRTIRTKVAGCVNDSEFLAKLHCLRLAYNKMLENSKTREYIISSSKDLLIKFFHNASEDKRVQFLARLDELISFSSNKNNWEIMKEELDYRRVKAYNFFDIILDFVLLDAFDELANPPSSLLKITESTWLTHSMKTGTINTAVWTILRTKRAKSLVRDGFMSRFYDISECISPLLAEGFFIPSATPSLKTACRVFRESVLQYIRQVFSFQAVRFTNLNEVTEDVLQITMRTINELQQSLKF